MEKDFLRDKSTLRILGTGVTALTLWTMIKPVLILLAVPEEQLLKGTTGESPEVEAIIILVMLLIVGISVLLRLWVGLSARTEGTGKPHGKAYVFFAFVVFVIQVLLFLLAVAGVVMEGIPDESAFETVASLIVEMMSISLMGELAFTAMRVRKQKRKSN